jgi:hypothetical protein
MPGLVPEIHVLRCIDKKDVDGRDKPGHDETKLANQIRRIVTETFGPFLMVW